LGDAATLPFNTFEDMYISQVGSHLDLFETAERVYTGYVNAGMLERVTNHPTMGKLVSATMEVLVTVDIGGPNGSIIIGGFPDLVGEYKSGERVILDWKVNGYYSGKRVSIGKMPVYVCGDLTKREKLVGETLFSETGWGCQLGVYSRCTGINTGMVHQFAFNGIDKCRYAEFLGSINTVAEVEDKAREVHKQLRNFTALTQAECDYIEMFL